VAEIESYPDITIGLDRDGSLIIPEKVMRDIVLETLGCELWYNEKTSSLGVKLLRNEKFPPVSIVRSPGEGKKGLQGVIDAGNFLKRVGFQLPAAVKKLSFRYFKNHQLLEIQLKSQNAQLPDSATNFLDDYPGLED